MTEIQIVYRGCVVNCDTRLQGKANCTLIQGNDENNNSTDSEEFSLNGNATTLLPNANATTMVSNGNATTVLPNINEKQIGNSHNHTTITGNFTLPTTLPTTTTPLSNLTGNFTTIKKITTNGNLSSTTPSTTTAQNSTTSLPKKEAAKH